MPRFSPKLTEHFNTPRNAGEIALPTVVGEANRAGRARRVTIYLKVEDNLVSQASFTTFGCGVTIACCSALTELATGRSIDECHSIKAADIVAELDGIPADKQFCAGVAVAALRQAIEKLHN